MARGDSLVSIVTPNSQPNAGAQLARGKSAGHGRAGQIIPKFLHLLTVLDQDVEALLDEQIGVEHNEAERQRKHIVAGALAEEVSDCYLREGEISLSAGGRRKSNGRCADEWWFGGMHWIDLGAGESLGIIRKHSIARKQVAAIRV